MIHTTYYILTILPVGENQLLKRCLRWSIPSVRNLTCISWKAIWRDEHRWHKICKRYRMVLRGVSPNRCSKVQFWVVPNRSKSGRKAVQTQSETSPKVVENQSTRTSEQVQNKSDTSPKWLQNKSTTSPKPVQNNFKMSPKTAKITPPEVRNKSKMTAKQVQNNSKTYPKPVHSSPKVDQR